MATAAINGDTRALMVRKFPISQLDAMHATARARGMGLREYILALFELHRRARVLVDSGGRDEAPLHELLEELGLQTVQR